ncbi:hypothetical protein AGDE_09429 [Angomonas deanei]|nr:hypothetical protein AGDE_09429 [Angomonas deanei]|eukprot:EPY30467.1 hypothetical protein AGDE_09429 [Angomonas deanei]
MSSGTLHTRAPVWMEDKNVSIDGSVIPEDVIKGNKQHWSVKYRKELLLGEVIQDVRKQKRFENKHDVIGFVSKVRRWAGYAEPLDEKYAEETLNARFTIEEEARRLAKEQEGTVDRSEEEFGMLREGGTEPASLSTAWKVLVTTAETGRPLAKVAQEYRPRVDFYGIDPFLSSAPSLMWFSTKCGIGIGLIQGTLKTIQAVNVDVQFLKASGVGLLSVLNMAVFASVVKWGGNALLFSGAFCIGDRAAKFIKRATLPAHDANTRSTSNYIAGFACAGSTVGIMPWWVLSDTMLAIRMATSGMVLGAGLGLVVGLTIQHLVSTNLGRLDVTVRQLRRYEALMLRERRWAAAQMELDRDAQPIWW